MQKAPTKKTSHRSEAVDTDPAARPARRLWFFSSMLETAWRAAKSVAKVPLTLVSTVAENLGLNEFSGEKSVTLFTFDASSSLESLLPGADCTASSTLEATVSFHLKIASADIDIATLELSGTLANLVEIISDLSWEKAQEWHVVSSPRWNFAIPVGPVPVVVDIGASLFAGYHLSVTGAPLI